MAKVWIAEKPSAASDLAAGLCLAYSLKSERDRSGLINLSNGDIILSLAGHLLETVKPSHYLSKEHAQIEKNFDFAHYRDFLPILPAKLIKLPRCDRDAKTGKSTGKPFRPYELAAKVLTKATEIVNAGDTDREGQLIVDELLEHLGINPYGSKPMVWRFGTSSNLVDDIAAALKQPMEKNSDPKWRLRCSAAETRQYLDFAWGMNLSMVGQVQNQNPRISAGRVQTPVLSMVETRDAEIDKFKSVQYYVPVIIMQDGTKMRWFKRKGSEGAQGFDTQGRIIDEMVARQIVAKVSGGLPGEVSLVRTTEHKEKPPLPFSMGTLLSTASKELGITLDEAKECAGNLNKKHKAISYVGTDCKFLPTSMHAEAPNVLRVLAKYFPKVATGANPALISPAFNDAKLDEHYGIVPTTDAPTNATPEEMGVYRIVAKRFIAQFYPEYVFRRNKVEMSFGADHFESNTKQDVKLGWKEVEGEQEGEESTDAPAPRDKDQPEDEVHEVQR
jgi:DNA topoisomerase III